MKLSYKKRLHGSPHSPHRFHTTSRLIHRFPSLKIIFPLDSTEMFADDGCFGVSADSRAFGHPEGFVEVVTGHVACGHHDAVVCVCGGEEGGGVGWSGGRGMSCEGREREGEGERGAHSRLILRGCLAKYSAIVNRSIGPKKDWKRFCVSIKTPAQNVDFFLAFLPFSSIMEGPSPKCVESYV